ncbi:chemotaxis protein CheA [Sphingomonas sp. CARO-RG-8B-R24-01]|uniref:chemotaxis protein CheA n=1 Tax=Sphingomonas sp. CARO-RG-8B-R24-01 TaxID=2914831 RepID=UPI001F5AB92D|nr:chemotaxis protein CheA [Sphingomonas sp. CARO-RG-8B-R24-01]
MSNELDEIQGIFFEECAEGLLAAEQGLAAMQAGDTAPKTIASVFRAVHSIKGGAGAFGHAALTAFAHRFENVLEEIRAGRIAPAPGVVAVMLGAFDKLSDHVAAAQGTMGRPDDAASLAALEAILAGQGAEAVAAPAPAPVPEPSVQPVVAPGAESDVDPFGFEPVAVVIEEFPEETEAAPPCDPEWTIVFAPSRSAMANGAEPILVIRELEDLGGRVSDMDTSALPPLRDLDPEQAYLRWTLKVPGYVSEDQIGDCFDFVAPDSAIDITRERDSKLLEQPPVAPLSEPGAIHDLLHRVEVAAPAIIAAAAPPASTPMQDSRTGDAGSQTIRVDLHKLDMLLNLVGELVIRGSILSDRLSPADQQRVELPEQARLTREIQDTVMSLRAQPIRQAFNRVPRMLRDLTAETGKQVTLETHGETTEVDKGVIEKIGDPLTHLIRNAVDHGIELPEERLRAGKPAEGVIRLSAAQKGARIVVTVADDGRGIDRARVRAKAIEKGMIGADAVLSDEEIDQLICAPGFSTANTVSNISGRGVGMDVVRSNVEALGGRVDISSVPGRGTTFTLVLPLTLAILDGMVIRLAGQRFVLPLAHVVEAIRPEPGQVRATTPGSEVIEVRGTYLPVRRLAHTFGLHDANPLAPEDSLVIIVESETAGNVGLMVDTIDDRREVVIKSLEQNLHPIRGLGGATILGDGSIALILDVEALVAPVAALSRTLTKGLAA